MGKLYSFRDERSGHEFVCEEGDQVYRRVTKADKSENTPLGEYKPEKADTKADKA